MTCVSRLYLMQLANSAVPIGNDQTLQMVLVCYLVQTQDGRNILIDTGLPVDYTRPAGMPPHQNQKNVLEHLAELNVRPEDIDTVVCTHFDPDHAGYHDSFVGAEFIVQREHYEVARGGHPRFAAARAHWDDPRLHYRLVDGDVELVPGLTLLKTSGHAPAHQSVLVQLPNTGYVLLAIDAVILAQLFTVERPLRPNDDNLEQARASTQKLLDIVADKKVALVVFGHDGLQWETLKKAPQFYE